MNHSASENSSIVQRDESIENHWSEFYHHWLIRSDTTYLNHGSFGPPPNVVRQNRKQWIDALDAQPMDFYDRKMEELLWQARLTLAQFVNCKTDELVFVDNSTYGMNVIANSFPLKKGDEVLINNHEYGAVKRIWKRKCESSGSVLKEVRLPQPIESVEQVVDCLMKATNEHTKLLIISHITSPTAVVMPIKEICLAFTKKGIAIAVDAPHAPAQIDVDIKNLNCDFYTASCHKWLCATLGSGFLYVSTKWQEKIEPLVKSWGRLLPAIPDRWDEEFTWIGTKDPSAFLSVPSAIKFMCEDVGIDNFRRRSRYLATQAEEMLATEFGTRTIANREDGWFASMAHVPLPKGDHSGLQKMLWNEYRIEVPVIHFDEQWFVRVSCHLYNNLKHLETLQLAIRKWLI